MGHLDSLQAADRAMLAQTERPGTCCHCRQLVARYMYIVSCMKTPSTYEKFLAQGRLWFGTRDAARAYALAMLASQPSFGGSETR